MIRKIAKKNIFALRIIRNFKLNKEYPSWGRLIKRSREQWGWALQEAKKGSKVLIPTGIGALLHTTTLESMLSVALTLRGAEVHILLCDKFLPICHVCWIGNFPNQKKFIKYGPAKDICGGCFSLAYKMFQPFKIKIHKYSECVSSDEIEEAENISSAVPFHEIKDYLWNGIAVGEHALAGALRFFSRGDLDGEPYAESILRRYFKASLLTAFAINNLLTKHNFNSAVFTHGIYVPQGIVGEVCRQKGVHVVNWVVAYRNKSFIFSHDDTYHHTLMTEPIEKWMNIVWNERLDSELMNYLKSRWKGTNDWVLFHDEPKFKLNEIAEEIGADFSKPCIGMLTSVMWDAVLHYPSNAFPNMLEWVMRTIEYFIKRSDLQLLIRIHPAEIRGTLPSRQRILDEVKKVYRELPKNIILIPPESYVSTYALMSQCDTVIIYNTKTGVELTAMGIPVIVVGEAWIRNKGFAIDVRNPEEYFKILDKLPLRRGMSPADTIKAKKYAYHFFFRRMMPLEFMEKVEGNNLYKIDCTKLEDMALKKSLGLDIICEGILHGRDFIYPAEQL